VSERTRLQRAGKARAAGCAALHRREGAHPGARRLAAVCLLAAALLPGEAFARQPRTSILPFGRHEVERQLRSSLCSAVTCVSPGDVTTKGRIDWRKVSAQQLTGVVTGRLTTDPKTHRRLVDIQVFANAQVILVRKKVLLQQGYALSPSALKALSADLVGVLMRAYGPGREPGAPPAAAAVPTPSPAEVVPPTVAPPGAAAAGAAAAKPAAPAGARPPAAPAAEAEAPAAEGPAAPEEAWPPLVEVQASAGILHRQYGYTGGQGTNPVLRNAIVPLAAQPTFYIAVYPLRAPDGVFSSLGIEAAASTSVGMQLQRENDTSGKTFPAVSFGANVGLRLNLRLSKAVTLSPVLGWQLYNFDVHIAADGTVLTGQPAVHWRAFAVGLKLDVAFNAWCSLFAEFSYLYVYSAGPLTSAPYFTDSSASPSFDTALGLGFRVAPRVQLRVSFVLARYAVDFSGGTGPAPVTGASDQVLGGNLAVRYSF
jgi:hypothetical protein